MNKPVKRDDTRYLGLRSRLIGLKFAIDHAHGPELESLKVERNLVAEEIHGLAPALIDRRDADEPEAAPRTELEHGRGVVMSQEERDYRAGEARAFERQIDAMVKQKNSNR